MRKVSQLVDIEPCTLVHCNPDPVCWLLVAGVLGLVWAVMWYWRDIGFDGSTITVPLCGQVHESRTNIETIGCSTNSVILARTFYTVNIH